MLSGSPDEEERNPDNIELPSFDDSNEVYYEENSFQDPNIQSSPINMADAVAAASSQSADQTVQHMVTDIAILRQEKGKLEEEVANIRKQTKATHEEHNAAVLHLETLNMMTKYQLVFIKLETSLMKVFSNERMRGIIQIQRRFVQWRHNTERIKNSQKGRSITVLNNFKSKMASMISQYKEKQRIRTSRLFHKWFINARLAKIYVRQKKEKMEDEKKYKLGMSVKDQELNKMEIKATEHIKEIESLKVVEKGIKLTLKEKEHREKEMKEAYEKLKKKLEVEEKEKWKMPKKLEERLEKLETQVSSLEEENTGLKEKLEDTEDNVGDFINDMSHLLDTHEFGKFAIQDFDFDESNEMDEEDLLGGGTGGSKNKAKMYRKENSTSIQKSVKMASSQNQTSTSSSKPHGFNTKYKL